MNDTDPIENVRGVGPVLAKYFKEDHINTRGDLKNKLKTSDDVKEFNVKHKTTGGTKSALAKLFAEFNRPSTPAPISTPVSVDPPNVRSMDIKSYLMLAETAEVTRTKKSNFRHTLLMGLLSGTGNHDTTQLRRLDRSRFLNMNSIFFVDDLTQIPYINDITSRQVVATDDTLMKSSVYNSWWRESKIFREACELSRRTQPMSTKMTKFIIYLAVIRFEFDDQTCYFHYVGKAKNGITDRWRNGHVDGVIDALSDPLTKGKEHQLVDTVIAVTGPENVMIFIISSSSNNEEMEEMETKMINKFNCVKSPKGLNMVNGKSESKFKH